MGKRGGPVQLLSESMKLKREGATEFRECADEVEDGESDMKIVRRGGMLWKGVVPYIHGCCGGVVFPTSIIEGRPSRE